MPERCAQLYLQENKYQHTTRRLLCISRLELVCGTMLQVPVLQKIEESGIPYQNQPCQLLAGIFLLLHPSATPLNGAATRPS